LQCPIGSLRMAAGEIRCCAGRCAVFVVSPRWFKLEVAATLTLTTNSHAISICCHCNAHINHTVLHPTHYLPPHLLSSSPPYHVHLSCRCAILRHRSARWRSLHAPQHRHQPFPLRILYLSQPHHRSSVHQYNTTAPTTTPFSTPFATSISRPALHQLPPLPLRSPGC